MSEMALLPSLITFLKEHKELYTVRHWRYTGTTCNIVDVGSCNRKFVRKITQSSDLMPFVSLSGFNSKEEWMIQIRKFIKHGDMYLYRITLKN